MDEDTDLGQLTLARTAQMTSLVASIVESTARMRTQRLHDRAARDDHAARAAAAQRRTAAAQARTVYGATWDPVWPRTASTMDAARVWAAAVPYADADPYAARAQRVAEQRLRELHPVGMRRYDDLRAAGVPAGPAMRHAVTLFLVPPDHPAPLSAGTDSAGVDPVQAAAAERYRARAAAAAGVVDDPSTPTDEAAGAGSRRAGDQAAADTAAAQAGTRDISGRDRWSYPGPPQPTVRAARAATRQVHAASTTAAVQPRRGATR